MSLLHDALARLETSRAWHAEQSLEIASQLRRLLRGRTAGYARNQLEALAATASIFQERAAGAAGLLLAHARPLPSEPAEAHRESFATVPGGGRCAADFIAPGNGQGWRITLQGPGLEEGHPGAASGAGIPEAPKGMEAALSPEELKALLQAGSQRIHYCRETRTLRLPGDPQRPDHEFEGAPLEIQIGADGFPAPQGPLPAWHLHMAHLHPNRQKDGIQATARRLLRCARSHLDAEARHMTADPRLAAWLEAQTPAVLAAEQIHARNLRNHLHPDLLQALSRLGSHMDTIHGLLALGRFPRRVFANPMRARALWETEMSAPKLRELWIQKLPAGSEGYAPHLQDRAMDAAYENHLASVPAMQEKWLENRRKNHPGGQWYANLTGLLALQAAAPAFVQEQMRQDPEGLQKTALRLAESTLWLDLKAPTRPRTAPGCNFSNLDSSQLAEAAHAHAVAQCLASEPGRDPWARIHPHELGCAAADFTARVLLPRIPESLCKASGQRGTLWDVQQQLATALLDAWLFHHPAPWDEIEAWVLAFRDSDAGAGHGLGLQPPFGLPERVQGFRHARCVSEAVELFSAGSQRPPDANLLASGRVSVWIGETGQFQREIFLKATCIPWGRTKELQFTVEPQRQKHGEPRHPAPPQTGKAAGAKAGKAAESLAAELARLGKPDWERDPAWIQNWQRPSGPEDPEAVLRADHPELPRTLARLAREAGSGAHPLGGESAALPLSRAWRMRVRAGEIRLEAQRMEERKPDAGFFRQAAGKPGKTAIAEMPRS